MLEANNKLAKILGEINSITYRENEAKKIEEENKIKLIDIANREDKLKVSLEKIEKDKKNLEELRNITEPKIRDINVQLEYIKNQKKEIEEKEIDINRKIEQDKAMIKGIEEREAKVSKREKDVMAKEEEIKRKILLKGIDK